MVEIALSVIVSVNKPFTALSQHYFYSSCSRANLQAVPFGSGMMLRGPLNLVSNVAASKKAMHTDC